MSQPHPGWGLPHLNHKLVTIYRAFLPPSWDKMPFIAQQRYLLEIGAVDYVLRDRGVIYAGVEDESNGFVLERIVDLDSTDCEDIYRFLSDCVAPWVCERIRETQGETCDIPVAVTTLGFVIDGVRYDDPESTQHFIDLNAYLLSGANSYWVRSTDGSKFTHFPDDLREAIRDMYGEEFLYEERDTPLIA